MKTTNRREAILSKTEYDIMSIIWDINRSVSAREIYDLLDPKPAYTTLATEMRMLYEKGFVDYFKKDGEGKTHYAKRNSPKRNSSTSCTNWNQNSLKTRKKSCLLCSSTPSSRPFC